MASLVIGYNVEYAADRAVTEAFLARARALHADLAAPCTLYLREDIVREHADALRGLAGNPLFDLQMTLVEPMKTVCQYADGQTTLWRGATLADIDAAVDRAKRTIREELDVDAIGLSDALGAWRGLQDRPDILEILARHGIRFTRTFARNPFDWHPVDFDVEPFPYAFQGFPDIVEFPAQGWQDSAIRKVYGWADRSGYLDYLRADADEAARRDDYLWSFWSHDWSAIHDDPSLEVIEGMIRYSQELGIELVSQADAYRSLRGSRGRKSRRPSRSRRS